MSGLISKLRRARGSRTAWAAGDLAVGVALLVIVGFAPAASLAADQLPLDAPGGLHLPAVEHESPTDEPAPEVRDLPAGVPEGLVVERPVDLVGLTRTVLGPAGAARLMRLLQDDSSLQETAVGGSLGFAPYPYEYPPMTRLLDRAAPVSNAVGELGAAMVLLASRTDPTGNVRYPDAAPAAYALLESARSDGDCEAQLNLLLLVAADDQPRDDVVAEEAQRAADSCPNDPTPGWVLGQFQSQRAWMEPSDDAPGDPVPADSQAQANATLASLVERYPESADAWRGFGDVRLRAGLRTVEDQPFTARDALQTAVAYYRHADELSGTTESAPGLARALIGLEEPEEAASVLDGEVERSLAPGPQLEILTQAQEEAHDFAAASTTARDLEERGADAYPDGPALFPVPSGSGAWVIGVGADERERFTVALQPGPGGAGGGAVVGDSSFVPTYRTSEFVETQADCPGWAWRRDAMLAGQPMAALADWPNGYTRFDNGRFPGNSCGPFTDPRPVFRIEAGVDVSLRPSELTYWVDERQNMWRWAGDLARAEDVVEAWDQATHGRQALPALRLGEIQYLQERYDDAAATFGIAARRTRLAQWNDDLGVEQALLDRGASQLAAGRRDEAMALLRSLQTESLRGVSYHKKDITPEIEGRFALVGYHSSALMGDSERESGEFLAAVEDYDAASELVPVLEEAGATGYRVERVHNNKAVTELALRRLESAEEAVRQALQVDRMNPAFLMTAAAVADAAGDTASAADFNARALESDPGAYPAANNEGVQLARLGRDDDAEVAFRRSIGANPDYALGWFNLGVLQSSMGPSHLLASQGALARAFALDPALADRDRELTIDTNTYRTGLDLSKPLPPGWSFADVQRVSPTASAGVLAVVLFAFALARATGRGRGVELAEKWLGPVAEQLARMPILGRLRAPAWALGVTVLLLSLPAIRHPSIGVLSIVAGALGLATLAVVATRARGIAASRSGVEVIQESWTPGLVFGLGTGLVGAPWAPLPVARAGRQQWRVHAAAPVTLALIAVVLFVEAAWLDVPITRSWAIATLIMTASTLLPVEPLDGAHLGKRGLVASVGVVAGAILVALGVA